MLISKLFKSCLEHVRHGNLPAAYEMADAIYVRELTPVARRLFGQTCQKSYQNSPILRVAMPLASMCFELAEQ